MTKFFKIRNILLAAALGLYGCGEVSEDGPAVYLCSASVNIPPITVRLYKDFNEDVTGMKAEVSYGVSGKSAYYFSGTSRVHIQLSKNDSFPDCTLSIDQISGVGRQTCIGGPNVYPNDPRSKTFDLMCEFKGYPNAKNK